jgi:DNA-binding beta-propeller fold protein YncE
MGRKNYKIVIVALLCCFAFACKKDDHKDCCTLPPADTAKGQVYVVCEGSLGNGNAALTLYYPDKDIAYEDVYKSANGQGIGDVFQSMTAIGDHYFLCVNNSDKILVINKTDWKLIATLSVPKPRYIQQVSTDKAYVSTLFSDKMYIIDPVQMHVKSSFSMPYQNPEGMFLYNGNTLFTCLWDTANAYLYSVNAATGQVTQSATLAGRAPQEAVLDKNGHLWVLSGNVAKQKDASLTCIDPASGQVLKNYNFPSGADAMRPVLSRSKDTLYFIEVNYSGGTQYNGIYRMRIDDPALPAQAFVQAANYQYFWGIDISQKTGNIYIADPKGFIQKGTVLIYRPDGTKITEFKTGVGPGHFYFNE